jgi:tetratricopeptide (TPR) repeat protein
MKGDLKKAAKLYKRSKFPQVIRLLEPQIFRYRQNYDFFYLAGMSCLNTGDLGGANTYLQRGLGLKANDTKANIGLALVNLRRQDIQEAIRCYLEVLDADPGNKVATRGLTLLKKNASPTQVLELIESGRLDRLLPDGRKRRLPTLIASLSIIIIAAAAVVLVLKYTNAFGGKPVVREPSVEMMSLDDLGGIVDFSGVYKYVLTEKEIERTFAAVKDYFSRFSDNLAKREINRLLGSNASFAVKEQVRTISGYIPVPDFTTIRDPFDYDLVAADPFLYGDTYVVWTGKLSNLSASTKEITFDLLVGYEKNQILLGIVAVKLQFAASLDDGDAVEVLGRVKVTDTTKFFLEVISIHKLIPEEDT